MTNLSIQEGDEGIVVVAKIVPGSSSTRICGLLDGMLKIKVAAPPEKGNAVSLISGKTSPIKKVRILGISAETLLKKLNLMEQDVRE